MDHQRRLNIDYPFSITKFRADAICRFEIVAIKRFCQFNWKCLFTPRFGC